MSTSKMGTPASVEFFFFQAEDGIRDVAVTGVQTCALPISPTSSLSWFSRWALALGDGRQWYSSSSVNHRRSQHMAGSFLARVERGLPSRTLSRSEERRVGKEWRCGGGAEREKRSREEERGR